MDDLRKEMLLGLIDEAYDHKAWHGPNLRGSIRGLEATQAAYRPGPGRKNIAEQVLHAAYWKYVVRRRVQGERRGGFVLKGTNWFPVEDSLSPRGWSNVVQLLDDMHLELREAIIEFPGDHWLESPSRSKYTYFQTIRGIAAHDIYHAGQIQLLKRLATP